MPTIVTWNDGSNPATNFTVPDDVLNSLDQYRQTMTSGGNPIYATVKDMVVGIFVNVLATPALTQFPTPRIQAAKSNLDAAKAALEAAQANALPGIV